MSTSKILMLEHDEDDRYIASSFFTENNPEISLDFVINSDELFSHLAQCKTKALPYPSLILMNQNCAPLSAIEVLKRIKTDPHYNFIPIVVLGNGSFQTMVKQYYAAGASSFIQKPFTHNDTNRTISNFVSYWFNTVEIG